MTVEQFNKGRELKNKISNIESLCRLLKDGYYKVSISDGKPSEKDSKYNEVCYGKFHDEFLKQKNNIEKEFIKSLKEDINHLKSEIEKL